MIGIDIGDFRYNSAERAAAPTAPEKAPAVEDSKLITETAALSSDNFMYSKLIAVSAAPTADNLFDSNYFAETAVPSSNNPPHAEAAASIADNLFYSKYFTETHNLSHTEAATPKYFTETAAPSSHNLSHTEAAVPTADINLFDSKLTETAAPSSPNLSHTEAAALTADNLFDSKFTETAAPSSHKPSHTEAAAPTLETGFSDNGIKEAEAPTSERGIFLSTITEAVALSSEKGAFVSPITETTAPFVENGLFHYKIKGAAAPTFERGASDCKITEAGVPTSEKGVILNSITEIMAPTLKNGVSYYQNKDPTSERGVSHCKIKGTEVHTAEKGVIFNSITKIPAPTLHNGAFYYQNKCTAAPISERGVSQCKIKGAGARTAEEGVFSNSITKTAVPSALENGVCSEDSAAPTSERGFPHYKISDTGVCTSEKEVFLKPATETSENGVSYYEPGFPDVLRSPSLSKQIADDSKVSLYAYIIHYLVLQEGQDPINITPPTEFVLLNHFLLDEEVAHHFSVRLNLPHQECVAAHLTPCDMISFTLDQVNSIEVFNGVLFSIVRLRSKLDFENFYTVENKTKGYYVMPLKDGVDLRTKAEELIDWTTVFDLVHCKLNMKEWMHHHATLGPDTNSYFLNDTGAFAKGWLRLKCGVYKEEDLIDAFVTYGPFNTSCFIVGISDELCGLSIMQGSDCCLSYKDYWLKRFEVELKYASQPLLVGYCLSHAGNFLQRPSQADLDPPNISVHQKLFGAKQKQRESLFLQKSVFYRQNLRAIYGGELFVYRQFFVH